MIYFKFLSLESDKAKYKIKKTGIGSKKNIQVSAIAIDKNKIKEILIENNSANSKIRFFFLEKIEKSIKVIHIKGKA